MISKKNSNSTYIVINKFSFQDEEFYVCIYSHREGDTILFHHEGGVDIGDVDAKVNH